MSQPGVPAGRMHRPATGFLRPGRGLTPGAGGPANRWSDGSADRVWRALRRRHVQRGHWPGSDPDAGTEGAPSTAVAAVGNRVRRGSRRHVERGHWPGS